jgi:hypothetical protein
MRRRQGSTGPDPGHGRKFLRNNIQRRREKRLGNDLRDQDGHWTKLVTDNTIGTTIFFLRHVGHTYFAANIGWSLESLTETSKTLSFRLSANSFACSSDMPPSRLRLSVAFLSTGTVPWKSSSLRTGLPPSPFSATKRQVPRSVLASGMTELYSKSLSKGKVSVFGVIRSVAKGIADKHY